MTARGTMAGLLLALVAVLLLLRGGAAAAAAAPALANACTDAVDSCDTSKDYFANKIGARRYARQITDISYHNTYVDVVVNDSINLATYNYRLVRCGCEVPADTAVSAQLIAVPAADVFVGDTVSLGLIGTDLGDGVLERVSAIPAASYVYSDKVHKLVDAGKIRQVGYAADGSSNLAALLPKSGSDSLAPLAIINPYDVLALGKVNKGAAGGSGARVASFVNMELAEATPLGRAEYVRMLAVLLGREAQAEAAYDEIVREYEETAAAAAALHSRPSVALNIPDSSGQWAVAAGGTYSSQLLVDANGAYRLNDTRSAVPITLTLEQASANFSSADVLLNAYTFGVAIDSVAQLTKTYPALADFVSVQCGQAWPNDRQVRGGTANNYFELAVVRPELVLQDLVRIFHPGALAPQPLVFYRHLDADSSLECPLVQLPQTPADGGAYVQVNVTVVGADRFGVEDELVAAVQPALAELVGGGDNKNGTTPDVAFFDITPPPPQQMSSTLMSVTYPVAAGAVGSAVAGAGGAAIAVESAMPAVTAAAVSGGPKRVDSLSGEPVAGVQPTSKPQPPSNNDNDSDKGGGGLSGGQKAGISVGVIVFVLLLLAVLLLVLRFCGCLGKRKA